MIALTQLLLRDYIRSWKIVAEIILVIIFLTADILQKNQPVGNLLSIGFFSILIVPVTALRLSKAAATIKCRYILAAGLGRTAYVLSVAASCLLITGSALLVTLIAAGLKSPGIFDFDFSPRYLLLAALVLITLAISLLCSRMLMWRWGAGIAIIVIGFISLMDSHTFRSPVAKTSINYLQDVLPWSKRILVTLGSDSLDGWLIITAQVIAYGAIIMALTVFFFHKKELIFEDS